MKILFLSHYYAPEGNAPASRVSSMCRRWVAAGHEVTVVTCAPNVPNGIPYEGYTNAWCREEWIDGVRVVRVKTYLAANSGSARRILNYLSFCLSAVWRALRLPDTDLVIATSPQFFCGWAGVLTAWAKRRPFVLEIRDIWPESIDAVGALGGGGFPRRAAMGALAWLERRMYRAATHIVAVGDGYKRKLLERDVPEHAISVVTNGVEAELFQPREPDTALRAEAGAGPDDFLVAYIGTVGMAHGLEVVLDAARIARARGLDHLRFAIVGDGARLVDLRAELAREPELPVRLVGRRPKTEMPAWLASVDACFVHLRDTPTFATVLPSKIFEAAAMARPILLGVRGEAARLVEALEAGVALPPEDAAALVDAAAAWMRAPGDARAIGARGRERVLADYSLDELARRYREFLEGLVPGAALPSEPQSTPRTEPEPEHSHAA